MKVLEAIKSIDYLDVAERALWTFFQAFLAVFIVAGENIVNTLFSGDWSALLTLLLATTVAALAAALSALKTVVLEVIRNVRVKIDG